MADPVKTRGKRATLPLLLGVAAIAILVWGILGRRDESNPPAAPRGQVLPVTDGPTDTGTMLPALREFLSADDRKPPRTFAFDRLAFAPNSAEVRIEDQQTINLLTQLFQANPTARGRVVGNAVGAEPATLAKARAEAVVAALLQAGVKPGQIEASSEKSVTGRPELVVLSK